MREEAIRAVEERLIETVEALLSVGIHRDIIVEGIARAHTRLKFTGGSTTEEPKREG